MFLLMLSGCWVFWQDRDWDDWEEWEDWETGFDDETDVDLGDWENPDLVPSAFVIAPTNDSLFEVGDEVRFAASISASGSDVVQTEWLFDGDVMAYGDETVMTLDAPGHFPIVMVVTDDDGDSDNDVVNVYVRPPGHSTSCAITFPKPDDESEFGSPLGVVAEIGLDDYAWVESVEVSNNDGFISTTPDSEGRVSIYFAPLTEGTHDITLTVADKWGHRCGHIIKHTVAK
jgi:hypothetical protein